MRFQYMQPGYAAPDGYGYYAEDPYLAQDPYLQGYGYGEIEPYGYYAEAWDPAYGPVGEYAEDYPVEGYGAQEPVGYYAEEYPVEGYEEVYPPVYPASYPMGYYAEDYPYAPVGEAPDGWYGQMPEMPGYGEMEPLEEYPDYAPMSGYVREGESPYNAGCPLPTNVAGYGEPEPLEGYMPARDVSPTCQQFTPQPGPTTPVPETFKPLW